MKKEPFKSNPKLDEASLFRAIGDIDDRFVAEAMDYRAPKRKPLRIVPVLSAAAAALLIFGASVRLVQRLPSLEPNDSAVETTNEQADTPTPPLWTVANGYAANTSLLSCLMEVSTEVSSSQNAPDLFDGVSRIIWRDESTGTYYYVSLEHASEREKQRLSTLLDAPKYAKTIAAGSDDAPFSLWISEGDGTAVSPYLPKSDGTVFCGSTGDYAPEYLPAEDLAELIEALIRGAI